MGNYNDTIIPIDDYINRLRNGGLYDGYVEGLGYAYYESRSVAPQTSRHSYGYYKTYYECKLEMSKDTIRRLDGSKIFQRGEDGREEEQERPLSGRIMNIALVASGALLADDATGIGVADDVAIPFILAGGCIVALIVLLTEGNSHYPGPWTPTIPAPWSPQATPPEPPSNDPNDENLRNAGRLGIFIGAARLAEEYYKTTGGLIRNKRAIDMINRPHIDRQRLDSLMDYRLRQFSEEFERMSLPARDATRVEIPKRIMPDERK